MDYEGQLATERYDAFDSLRKRFGNSTKKEGNLAARPSSTSRRKSDPRAFVRPQIAIVDETTEKGQVKVPSAKELAATLEAKHQAERNAVTAIKRRTSSDRPNSASVRRFPLHEESPSSFLKEKDNFGSLVSLNSVNSDTGYFSSKLSSGSLSPREGSESNLLEDSSYQVSDVSACDKSSPGWTKASDTKSAKQCVGHVKLNKEEDVSSPHLEELRHTMSTWETTLNNITLNGVEPGYSPQLNPAHQRRSNEVRYPVPDSTYDHFLQIDEDWNENASNEPVQLGKFVPPKKSPPNKKKDFSSDNPPTSPAEQDKDKLSLVDKDIVPLRSLTEGQLPLESRIPGKTHTVPGMATPPTIQKYMLKLKAKKESKRRVSVGVVGRTDEAMLSNNPHQILDDNAVIEKTITWDESIGEWTFEGKGKPYSPQMEPKREKRRSRQIHFPAEDEVYKPFLEDDTNVDSLNNNEEHLAEIKLGKFLKRDTDTECQINKQKVEDKPTPPQVTVTSTTTLKTQEMSHKTGSYLKYESPSPYHGGREEVFKQKVADRAKKFGGGLQKSKSFHYSKGYVYSGVFQKVEASKQGECKSVTANDKNIQKSLMVSSKK